MAAYYITVNVRNEKTKEILRQMVEDKERILASIPKITVAEFKERYLSKKK